MAKNQSLKWAPLNYYPQDLCCKNKYQVIYYYVDNNEMKLLFELDISVLLLYSKINTRNVHTTSLS